MTSDDWRAAISGVVERPRTVRALTFLKSWPSASAPAATTCDDGGTYIAKGSQQPRMCFNDHVVHRLGVLLGAPTAEVVFVNVADLKRIEPRMNMFGPDPAHGTREISNCGDRQAFEHVQAAENRSRFGALCILYSWVGGGDQQMIYENAAPHLVHSVDHGHFFPGGPNWTADGLRNAGAAVLDVTFAACGLVEAELAPTKQRLRALTEAEIATVLGGPPDSWGVALEERVTLAEYLIRRRIELIGTA